MKRWALPAVIALGLGAYLLASAGAFRTTSASYEVGYDVGWLVAAIPVPQTGGIDGVTVEGTALLIPYYDNAQEVIDDAVRITGSTADWRTGRVGRIEGSTVVIVQTADVHARLRAFFEALRRVRGGARNELLREHQHTRQSGATR
jgi:hypothetical protein